LILQITRVLKSLLNVTLCAQKYEVNAG